MSLFIHRKYSAKGIPRLSSANRAVVTISDDIKDVLVGILLGDGLLRLILLIELLFLFFINISIQENMYDFFLCSSIIPVLQYKFAELEKKQIIKENRGKSGIYR